jgi:hypothetical protein
MALRSRLVPGRPPEYQFTLGIWHPYALPADKQNRAGFWMLDRGDEVPMDEGPQADGAVGDVQSFRNEVEELLVYLPRDEDWDIFFFSGSLYHLISLPGPALGLAPAILNLAKRRKLVSYDPQTDTLTLPRPDAALSSMSPDQGGARS